jgi:hypothetical protein
MADCIVTGYRLDDRGVKSESQYGQEYSLPQIVLNDSRVHPAFYPKGARRGLFPKDKVKTTIHLQTMSR